MKWLYCFIILQVLTIKLYAQKPPFQSQLIDAENYNNNNILSFKDGSFAVAKHKINSEEIVISKFDVCHNHLWTKKMKGIIAHGWDYGDREEQFAIETDDNGIILVFYHQNNPFVLKLTGAGNILWVKKIESAVDSHFSFLEIINCKDGGFFIGGILTNTLERFACALKFDSAGSLLWSNKYLSSYKDKVRKVSPRSKLVNTLDSGCLVIMEGGFILPGFWNFGNYPILFHIDKNGKIIWVKYIKVQTEEHTKIVASTSDNDGNIYLAGRYYKRNSPNGDFVSILLKLDKKGELVWSKKYTDLDYNTIRIWDILLDIDALTLLEYNLETNITGIFSTDLEGNILEERRPSNSNLLNMNNSIGNSLLISGSNILVRTSMQDTACTEKDSSLISTEINLDVIDIDVITSAGFGVKDTTYLIQDYKVKPRIICGMEYYPLADLGEDTILCSNQTLLLSPGENTKNYGHQFLWSTGDTTETIQVNKSGTYWVKINSGYCTSTDTVNIVFLPQVQSIFSQSHICPNDSLLVKSPQNKLYNFYWLSPKKQKIKANSFYAKDTGTYYLMLDGNGKCHTVDTLQLGFYPLPQGHAGPDTLLCYNQSYEMRGKGGISYKWIPAKHLNNDTIPNAIATPPDTQLYILVVKNAYGCTDTSQAWLKVRPPLSLEIQENTTTYCVGSQLHLSALAKGGDSLHYTYHWLQDNHKKSDLKTTVYKSGWHTVLLDDGCSQPVRDSIYIAVIPPPQAAFSILPDTVVIKKNEVRFQNSSKSATNYHWSFGSTGEESYEKSPVYIYEDTGKYFVTLIAYNAQGCSDTASAYVYVKDSFRVFIPNAFSPDNNGINDVFTIQGTEIKSFSYQIYNRWGEVIFHSAEDKKGWNGGIENRGEPVMEGVYIYTLQVTDTDNFKHYFSGTVTLLR